MALEREKTEQMQVVIGRNPVLEAFKSGKEIDTLYIAKGERQGIVSKIAALARSAGVVIKEGQSAKAGFVKRRGCSSGSCRSALL